MDTYSMMKGHAVPGVVTGKHIEVGGSLGRTEATGRGIMIITRLAAESRQLSRPTVAIQGAGNVGSISAKLISEKLGYTVVALSDVSGGVYCESGLNIPEILAFGSKKQFLKDYSAPGVTHISNEQLLTLNAAKRARK